MAAHYPEVMELFRFIAEARQAIAEGRQINTDGLAGGRSIGLKVCACWLVVARQPLMPVSPVTMACPFAATLHGHLTCHDWPAPRRRAAAGAASCRIHRPQPVALRPQLDEAPENSEASQLIKSSRPDSSAGSGSALSR